MSPKQGGADEHPHTPPDARRAGLVRHRGAALLRALGRPVLLRQPHRRDLRRPLGPLDPGARRPRQPAAGSRSGPGPRPGGRPMIGIFIYGVVVFALVCGALGLLAWGIVNERRDRVNVEQWREVFGETAAIQVSREPEGSPR